MTIDKLSVTKSVPLWTVDKLLCYHKNIGIEFVDIDWRDGQMIYEETGKNRRFMNKWIWLSLVIASICGLPIIVIGIYFMIQAKNAGDVVSVESGKLKVVEAPKDMLFDISMENPLLIRKVEMYQYCFVAEEQERSYDDGEQIEYKYYVEERFSEREQKSERAYDNPDFKGTTKLYENPEFPEGLESKWFYGGTEIGDNGVRLSERQIGKFKSGGYMVKIPMEDMPVQSGKQFGLQLVSDGTYSNGDEDKPQIGDIRVTFRIVDPEVLAHGFTAVGKTNEENGITYIGGDFEGLLLTSENMTREEAIERYKEVSEDDGSLLFWLGIGIFIFVFLLSAVIIRFTEKLSKNKEG